MAEPSKQRGLGRGLAALVSEFPSGQTSLIDIELGQVVPGPKQPRHHFDEDALNELAESIKSEGVVQPIVVRESDGGAYEIIAGERRWRAAQKAGLRTIPAVVRRGTDRDSLVLAMAENVARVDLNPIDQARAYAMLADELDLTQADIARRVGKSRSAVANTLRLLELPDAVLDMIAAGALSEGHGRAVLLVEGQDERLALGRLAAKRGLSVRQTEEAAKRAPTKRKKAPLSVVPGSMEDELSNLVIDAAWASLNLKAAVKRGANGGRVELHFTNSAELGRIIDQLRAERVSWAD